LILLRVRFLIVVRNIYYVYAAAVVVSIIVLLCAFQLIGHSAWLEFRFPSWVLPTLLVLYIPVHEYSHYLFAKRFNSAARVRFFPKLFALAVDYVSLGFWEYVAVCLAPQIAVGIPVVALMLLTSSKEFAYLLAFHIASSMGDYTSFILLAVHSLLHSRAMRFHILYNEGGGIVGSVAESAEGDLYVYLLEETPPLRLPDLHRFSGAVNMFIGAAAAAALTLASVFAASGILAVLAAAANLKLFTRVAAGSGSVTISVDLLPLYIAAVPVSIMAVRKMYAYTSKQLKMLVISLLTFIAALFVLAGLLTSITMGAYRCSSSSLEFNLTSTVFTCR